METPFKLVAERSYALRRGLVVAALLLTVANAAGAAPPDLESVHPRGVQRGGIATVTLSGERLDRVDELLFQRPGLRLASYRAIDDESAEATLRADADCPLGEHGFWLTGPHGVSELATIHVGRFPIVNEREANDTIEQAESQPLGVTIQGVVDDTDVDCFAFPLKSGDRVSAEVVAMRLGAAFLDAHLEIVNPQGEVVAACDDTALAGQDPLLSYVAESAGDHVVRVREAAFGGDYESHYQLHVGAFARPFVAFPCGGRSDEALQVELIGDASGRIETSVDLPPTVESVYEYGPADESGGQAITPVRLRVADLDNVLEVEPNQQPEQATESEAGPFALNGILQSAGDTDCFAFPAQAGESFEVEAYGARIGSPIDTVVEVFGPHGRPLVQNDDGVVHDSRLRFRAVQSGRHVVRVSDHLGRGGPTHVYRLEFRPIEPSLSLTVPVIDPLKPQHGQAIAVPQGGRFGLLVAARRQGFAGPIELEALGLPTGVRLTAEPIPVGRHLALMLFEADRDAPLGADLVDVRGYGDAPSGTVEGGLSRRVGLVFGEPRQTVYHDIRVDRLPLVVTEPAPFALSIEQPSAPLASDGLMELRVTVSRRDGWAGSIELTSPLLPEWVERSEDPVEIGPTEAAGMFSLIAGNRVTPGEQTVVLIGTARIDGTPVSIASNPVKVRLAEPHAELEIDRVAVEQGSRSQVVCHLDWIQPIEGPAIARLLGLPKHSSAPDIRVNVSTRRFEFPVTVGIETPASIHNTLYVELSVPESGEPVRQYLSRGGVLEVLEPGSRAAETMSRLEVLRRQAGRSSAGATR